ncbi:helix-turn-helix domain-containing protein [Thermoactinomyces sp. DSM 45892]|uniref:BglG family transcription antiterminator n=1 Tax=Thermoactinomyces sp. DSM 45892 TaxID=1882753 RepID=UPI00089C4833|nr:helix-turn-helix domain-containing protein [Thermoactinomyces sp. DSM 45892]SDY24282.1 transcriptional antiterminator, BglG family [Thermoactinomyces sp. DSM 45892]
MFPHYRQQEMIKVLLQDEKWYTLEEIACHVQCSVKTVRRDLDYLKERLPPDWQIQCIKGRGIKLYKPPHSSHTSMYSFFKQQDMQFQVLNQLLQGNIRTVSELADTLYVQVSALSPVLQRIQQHLDLFELTLQKRPLRIVGKETHIIYMFYELYYTTYLDQEWPFPNQKEIFTYISHMEQKLAIQFYPNYKQRLAYLLAIFVQRKKQGHNLTNLLIYEKIVAETPFYPKIKTTSQVLCDISLTNIDQVFITIAVSCSMFIYTNQKHYKQEILQFYYRGTSTVYRCTQDLVDKLGHEFGVAFHQDEEFLFHLIQYLRQIAYRYQFIPTITSPKSEWHEPVKHKHYHTFQKVSRIYTNWTQQYSFLPPANEEDILAITLQVEASFHLSQTYKKKALLYLGDSIMWKRYIYGVLYSEFGNTLSIAQEEVLDIQTCDLQNLGIDLIVTTVPLGKKEIPVIQVSVIPTRRELDNIKELLDTRSKEEYTACLDLESKRNKTT